MRALILEQNVKERSLIQHVLEKCGHEAVVGEDMEQAWGLIEKGETRLVVADGDADDFKRSKLIGRVRAAKILPVYFIVLTAGGEDYADADDNLRKPITASDLKARIMIGQRFLSLGASLTDARSQLENLALFDSLTGLMNQNAFFRSAQGELERARRASAPLSMIALDIDRFKSLNTEHGVEMGDEVLKIVGQAIREKSRPYDCIGRWTDDEFVIALPGVIGADAEKVAERIIKGVDSTIITFKNDTVKVGMSAGIVSASRISASTEVEPLIDQARQAMARAKEAGGNQVFLTYI
jgi:diguanylate cyclase (GGDEF)-like protein